MLIRPVHLLLIAAVIGIEAATDETYLDSMIDDLSHDVSASAGRGGSSMVAANHAGNGEEDKFGEADEDPPTPQADLAKPSESDTLSVGEASDADAGVGGRRRRKSKGSRRRRRRTSKGKRRRTNWFTRRRRTRDDSRKMLRKSAMLAFCKKSWPFRTKGTDKTIHACVKCKPDAPLPFAIGKHGKRLIWACDATKFKNKMKNNMALCKKSLSWLKPRGFRQPPSETFAGMATRGPHSETGASARITCGKLRNLIGQNDKADNLYSKHSHDLKLSHTAKLTSVSIFTFFRKNWVLKQKSKKTDKDSLMPLGTTRIEVEKTVHVAKRLKRVSQVFTILSHSVRACANAPGQPVQCLDTKRSKCIWSYVDSEGGWREFKSGRKLPGTVQHKKFHNQPCGPKQFIAIATSRKL